MRPAPRPAIHTTPHDTASPNRPPTRIAYRHATAACTPATTNRRVATLTTTRRHPTRTTGQTHKEATTTTKKDETTREHELTKTVQQDNTDTKRQRRHEKRNPDTGRETRRCEKQDADTRRKTGRQHETEGRDERSETKRHHPAHPIRETKRNDMRYHHRHTHGTPLSSPYKPPRRADKNDATIASTPLPDNRHEKANERERVSDTENAAPPANANHARHGKPITTPAPPPTRRAGDYMKSADKREPARGGRAKDKRKSSCPSPA